MLGAPGQLFDGSEGMVSWASWRVKDLLRLYSETGFEVDDEN